MCLPSPRLKHSGKARLPQNLGAFAVTAAVLKRVCLRRFKDGKKINHRSEFKMKKLKIHLNHALEIKDVCEEDSGLYTLVLKNSAAALERRLNITLVVNGNGQYFVSKVHH